ncbi:MAG TPA: UvrB/UvrC motif-containing protein [Candidatus Omnitrophota bacterium]|nr:UvrB/UvrC motif-containing protein [Candidatus Omnitrophota bacterium]
MKCDICGKNDATIHLTEVVNDQVTKLHICEECAKQKSDEMQSHFGLTDLLSGLVEGGDMSGSGGGVPSMTEAKCPTCGSTYQDFQKSGRIGCGRCYSVFSKSLSTLLRKIHGSDKHVGKMPVTGKSGIKKQEDLNRLKTELKQLVTAEEFEKAALLRDRIKEMEDSARDK